MAHPIDKDSILESGRMDGEFSNFLEDFMSKLPPGGLPSMSDPEKARFHRRLEDKSRRDVLPRLPILESTMSIPMRDGHNNEARIFTPQGAAPASGRPLIALIYGGGFITGDNNSATPYALPIATAYNAVVVNISYRLTPEFKFPVQANDVWDTLQWLATNASTLGANPSAGFVLGGESAGGNLAAVAVVKALGEGLAVPLTGLWLSIPWLLNEAPKGYEEFYLAREQNREAPFIDNDTIDMVAAMWCPDFSSPDFSPFNSLEHIDQEHPPTYIQVCGMDPLRDDALVYERVLSERGIKTKVDMYPGVPHAHWATCPYIKASQKSMVDAVVGVGWLLGQTAPIELIQHALGKLASDT